MTTQTAACGSLGKKASGTPEACRADRIPINLIIFTFLSLIGLSDLMGGMRFLYPGLHPGLAQFGLSGLVLRSKKCLKRTRFRKPERLSRDNPDCSLRKSGQKSSGTPETCRADRIPINLIIFTFLSLIGPSDLIGGMRFPYPGLHPGLAQIGLSGLVLYSRKYLKAEYGYISKNISESR